MLFASQEISIKNKGIIAIFILVCSLAAHAEIKSSAVRAAFEQGYKSQRDDKREDVSCSELDTPLQIFCQEGYGLGLYLSQKTSQERIKFLKNNSSQLLIHFIGAGIGFGMEGVGPQQLSEILNKEFRDWENKQMLIVDGWGFSQVYFKEFSLSKSVAICESFQNINQKKICWYGVGRSLFFLKTNKNVEKQVLAMPASSREWLFRGLGFAYAFAGQKEDNQQNKDIKKGMKIGKVLSHWMGRSKGNEKIVDFRLISCFEENSHPALCLP